MNQVLSPRGGMTAPPSGPTAIDRDRFVDPSGLPTCRSYGTTEAKRIVEQLNTLVAELARQSAGAIAESSSIYIGTAGEALIWMMLGDLAQRLGSATIANSPEECYQHAWRCIENSGSLSKSRVTFLEGGSGLIALHIALLSREIELGLDEPEERKVDFEQACEHLKSYAIEADRDALAPGEDEMLYGRAGLLYALHFASRQKHVETALFNSAAAAVATKIVNDGLRAAARERHHLGYKLVYSWHRKEYLGAAHGYVGIFHSLLLWRQVFPEVEKMTGLESGSLEGLITDSVWRLCQTAMLPTGNMASSVPVNTTGIDRLVHWCHGATGYILTLGEIALNPSVLQREKILATVVADRGCLRKLGLCHGLGGNGIALVRASNILKAPQYLQRAYSFAVHGFDHRLEYAANADRPLSLFEGWAGLIALHCALLDHEHAWFPGYDRVVDF